MLRRTAWRSVLLVTDSKADPVVQRLQRTFRAAVGGADVFRDFQTMRGAAQLVLSASQGVVAGEDRGRHGGGRLPPTSHTSLQCCGPSPGRGAAAASPDFSPLARKEANYSGSLHPQGGCAGQWAIWGG